MPQEPASRSAIPARGNPHSLSLSLEARIDSMPKVGLNRAAWTGLMLCFFFVNYDIGVMSVAIPSMSRDLGLTGAALGYPVTWNLVGYCAGAYAFGWIADRFGRQIGLRLTILALGASGILSGLSWDVWSLTVFRFLAGCGMGAVISLCSAYIGEVTPKNRRGGYLSRLFTAGLVLLLITGFLSLPVLAAAPHTGWRYLFAAGGLVLVVLPLVNSRSLVESPRWLVAQGRDDEARGVIARMERIAGVDHQPIELVPAANSSTAEDPQSRERQPMMRTLLQPPHLLRLTGILSFWFIFYIAVYGFVTYTPLILEGLGVGTSHAVFITVLSRVSLVVAGIVMTLLIEQVERRTLVIAGALIFAVGLVLLVFSGNDAVASAAVLVAGFGYSFVAPAAYTYTAEMFPTKVRGTASAISDGVGHLGGAIAPFVVLPILAGSGAQAAIWTIVGLLVASAVVIRTGVRTRNRSLSEIGAQ